MNRFYKDGMFGLIVGDAVGMPVQFEDRSERVIEPVTDMLEYRCFNMPKGAWTDDSSLALATLVSIKEKVTLDITDVADKFVEWLLYGKYTPFGYAYDIGFGCESAIGRYIKSKDAYSCGGKGERDNGNGSLMRILPSCICVYEKFNAGNIDINTAVKLVEDSSAITHAHNRSKIACGIYFFIVKKILDNRTADEDRSLFELIEKGIADAKNYYMNRPVMLTEVFRFNRIFDLNQFKSLPESSISSSGYVLDSLEAAIPYW